MAQAINVETLPTYPGFLTDQIHVPDTGIRSADLFAGWGGFTEGAAHVGVKTVWAANHHGPAVQVHANNHPDAAHVLQDLRQADWTKMPPYEVLLASPACPGHSTASQARRRPFHDAMRATAFAVIDCAEVTEPKAIVIENVPNFIKWKLYPDYRNMLIRLGYVVTERLVHASRHGVAQRRTRVIVTATRPGHTLAPLVESATEPAFGPLLETRFDDASFNHLWRPVATATDNVRARIERGRRNHGRRFLTQHVTGHPGVSLREPIRTITTAHSHWNLVDGDRYRALSGRELARGQGFRDTYRWPDHLTEGEVTKGIGNAVPPPVAAAVISSVVAGMN